MIGKVLGTRGKSGEVKVKPLTDNPDRFRRLRTVYIDTGVNRLLSVDVIRVRKQGNIYFLTLIHPSYENESLINHGALLKVPVKDVPPLKDGSYYFFQIEGLKVKTQGGRFLGTVTEILQTGSNDVFVVKGQKEYLIPFINDVVIDINLEAETITISLLEGLIDDL